METKGLYESFAKFQAECPEINLDSEVSVGSSYTFKYASMGNIVKTVRPVLAKYSLGFYQLVGEHGVKTVVTHPEGTIEGEWLPLVYGSKMQEVGSAITYAKRYSLSAILGIVTEQDDDGSGENKSFRSTPKQTYKAPAKEMDKEELEMVMDVINLYKDSDDKREQGTYEFATSLGKGLKQYGKLTGPQHERLVEMHDRIKEDPKYKEMIDEELDHDHSEDAVSAKVL